MRNKKIPLGLAAVLAVFAISTLMTATLAAAQTEKVLHSFGKGADGFSPESGLVADANGNLYGTADSGGSIAVGMVYELTPKAGQWVYKAIYNFKFNGRDGYGPWAGLIIDKAGNLYGTTEAGGLHDDGTVFELSPTSSGGWTETVLHSFNGTQGQAVFGGLTMDAAGNLYGTATGGGISTGNCSGFTYKGCGVVYELKHVKGGGWAEEVLHYFDKDGTDGFTPYGTLAFDKTGNLYGTTSFGGAFNYGTVFKLTPSASGWTESIVHSFNNNGSDGFYPSGGVIFDASGNLYGATGNGVNTSTERGTVYELSPAGGGTWTETILYSFQSNGVDGTSPGPLTFDSAGNLFGATGIGGSNTFGTVFKLSPGSGGWSETILYNFGNPPDAEYPIGGVVFDSAGNLYGATNAGGANLGSGAVFEITP
jgi:uncharacterized repeat protein (TIGR03803 family)